MGWERHAARILALRFRRHTLDVLHQMAPHQGDESRLISAAKQGRKQLEEVWSREREERALRKSRRGDGFTPEIPAASESPPARTTRD